MAKTTVKVAPTSVGVSANVVPYPLAFVGETSLLLSEGAYVYQYHFQSQTNELIPLGLPTSPASLQLVTDITPDGQFAALQTPRFPSAGGTSQRLSRFDFTTKTMVPVVDTAETGVFTKTGWRLAISADGRFVAFVSNSGSLSPFDHNNTSDVYVADFAHPGLVTLVSLNAAGTAAADGASDTPSLSADGRYVAFRSAGTDLLPGQDANGEPDVFVRDLWAGVTYLASVNSDGSRPSNSRSSEPAISADGMRVAFTSFASDLVVGDFNQLGDVFAFAIPRNGMEDSDADDLPDAWELRYFGSLAHDGRGDTDGDGMSDREEQQAGTIPTAAWSGLWLRGERSTDSRRIRLSWPAVAGKGYRIQFIEYLGAVLWSDLASPLSVSDPTTLSALDDLPTSGGSQRYYRVLAGPGP